MKQLNIAFLMILFCLATYGQTKDLMNLSEEERNEYLYSQSLKAVTTFGPDWLNYNTEASFSELKTFKSARQDSRFQENVGRRFYVVTFNYDKDAQAKTRYKYAAKVGIWADNGDIKEIEYGNGFMFLIFLDSFEELSKDGIRQKYITPFDTLKDEYFPRAIR